MDIHKPKPIHSLREFLGEIATITLGILIALSLEAGVEAWRNHETVEHARASLRDELRRNRGNLADAVASARASQAALKTLTTYIQGRLDGRHDPAPRGVALDANFTQLSTAAWDGVVATQALTHMPYDEAQTLARVYAGSRAFNVLEDRAETHWFDLAALPTDPSAPLSRPELAQEAAALKLALAYQGSIAQSGPTVLASYDKALQALGR